MSTLAPGESRRRARASRAAGSKRAPVVALVGSSGGHLLQLYVLKEFWSGHRRFWVTFDTPDARSLLREESVHWCHGPTNRSISKLLRNLALAVRVLRAERPTHIISTGAAVAVPFFYVGRLLGARLIYLEAVDRTDSASLTGRLVAPVTHHFLVQWSEQLRHYPRAEVVGPVL